MLQVCKYDLFLAQVLIPGEFAPKHFVLSIVVLLLCDQTSLGTNSLMLANCSVFCDVWHVQNSILGQNVMFGKFDVRTFIATGQCTRNYWLIWDLMCIVYEKWFQLGQYVTSRFLLLMEKVFHEKVNIWLIKHS